MKSRMENRGWNKSNKPNKSNKVGREQAQERQVEKHKTSELGFGMRGLPRGPTLQRSEEWRRRRIQYPIFCRNKWWTNNGATTSQRDANRLMVQRPKSDTTLTCGGTHSSTGPSLPPRQSCNEISSTISIPQSSVPFHLSQTFCNRKLLTS